MKFLKKIYQLKNRVDEVFEKEDKIYFRKWRSTDVTSKIVNKK